jgi:cupin superfamily acireductone dioxygenase involved in methionine salvage
MEKLAQEYYTKHAYHNQESELIEDAVVHLIKWGSQNHQETIALVALIAPLYMERGYTTEDFIAIRANVDDRMEILANER